MHASGLLQRRFKIPGYQWVRLALAGIILTAAVLKGYQLVTEPMPDRNLLDSRWFLMSIVEFELFFGLWLLLGAAPRLTWLVALVCFSGFACVSAYKGLLGEASCGCFGKVAVNPWYTCTLDMICTVLLLVYRPRATEAVVTRSPRRAAIACGLVGLVVGIPAAIAMVRFQAGSISTAGMIAGDGNLVVLTPREWAGKPFPLVEHINVGGQLTTGKWLVVLYHLGCPECEELIAKYHKMCHSGDAPATQCRIALIEVPEIGQSSKKLDLPTAGCLLGRMSDSREWFVSTPAVLLLEGGLVRQAYEGSSEKFFALLGSVSAGK